MRNNSEGGGVMAGARLTYQQRWKRLRAWVKRGHRVASANLNATKFWVYEDALREMDALSRPQPRKETRR